MGTVDFPFVFCLELARCQIDLGCKTFSLFGKEKKKGIQVFNMKLTEH